MKLQGLSIIFALIVIPMILVLSYYIQLQVDTIALQTAYDSKLLGATRDAMVAFEMNTANEDLSSVADSLRSIIEASNNIFINTLATSLELSNASKSYIQPYIPATLYTLYDGYYINSPTNTPVIGVDENGIVLEIDEKIEGNTNVFTIPGLKCISASDETFGRYEYDSKDENYYSTDSVPAGDFGQLLYKKTDETLTTNINDSDIIYENDYILKSYMPYSARYVSTGGIYSGGYVDVTINYTLDNYITIIGNIYENTGITNNKVKYYTKSGYLIKSDLVQKISINEDYILYEYNENNDIKYNENDVEQIIIKALEEGKTVKVKLKVKKDDGTFENIEITANNLTTDKDKADAIIYYAKASTFSKWVYTRLGSLREYHIVKGVANATIKTTEKETEEIIYDFEGKDNFIFDKTQDPENDSSTFVNHKFNVIKNSIQYNLNLAMSTYNKKTSSGYNFNMPVISNEEWGKIIDNISVVSFMQGLNCGLKTYNNYAIVSSTNNELTVIPEEIYFVVKEKIDLNAEPKTYVENFNNGSGVYHRIDCPRLKEEIIKEKSIRNNNEKTEEVNLTSFVSKEVKYDKIYDKNQKKYLYDHKNLACYTCIIDGNYKSEELDEITKKAYYIALGKERYNIYKMNAIKKSEGYQMLEGTTSTAKLKDIKQLEITFRLIESNDFNVNTVTFSFGNEELGLSNKEFTLLTNQAKPQTIVLNVDSDSTLNVSGDLFISNFERLDGDVEETGIEDLTILGAMINVKIVYK